MKLVLTGNRVSAGRWFAPRQGVLTLSVLNAGGIVDVDTVVLTSADGQQVLDNGNFSADMARWYPAVQSYFLPWHIDNMYLELLIERGLAGTILLLGLAAAAGRQLLQRTGRGDAIASFVAASLCGVLSVGLLSSVLDVPRVALLMAMLMIMGTLRSE